MKAVVFEQHGGVEALEWRDWPEPTPAPDEAVIRVRAAALNGFDPMVLNGIPTLRTPLPMIPGGDVAGEIMALGASVRDGPWRIGDRVLVNPTQPGRGMMGETQRGGFCEQLATPAEHLVPIPDGVSFEAAAALPVAYGTAYRMMITRGRVAAGERVLVLGAAGGVGVCCVQLARLAGAEVIACTTSPAKGERLRDIGADHVVNTAEEDLVGAAHRIWGKPRVYGESGGADVVVNYIGGRTWAPSLRTVKREGRLLTCGATDGYDPQTDLRYIWSYELNVLGCNGWTREDLEALLALAAEGRLAPVIDSVRPMTQVREAMQALIDRKVVGKLVLVP